MEKRNDVLSRRRYRARDLDGVTVGARARDLLALWFFIGRHGDDRACVCVYVRDEGERGRGS